MKKIIAAVLFCILSAVLLPLSAAASNYTQTINYNNAANFNQQDGVNGTQFNGSNVSLKSNMTNPFLYPPASGGTLSNTVINTGGANPVVVLAPAAITVTKIASGVVHQVAIYPDGTVWAWGNNNSGQLGNGTTNQSSIPVQVSGLSGTFTAVAVGQYHSLALKSDGTVWAWGYNADGEVGNGTTGNKLTPVQVSGLSGVVAIAAGRYHSLAVKSDGTVWAWGSNTNGQLGDGSTTTRTGATQVPGLTGVSKVAGGAYFSIALKSAGTVWAWGYNYYGELGNGNTTEQHSPVQVSSLTSVSAIASSGMDHSLAVKSDGTVWAWGQNTYGQLCDGTTTTRTTPVQVSGLTGGSAVAASYYDSIVLKTDGTVWGCGVNQYGELGNGNTTEQHSPVQASSIMGFSSGSVISAGMSYTSAITSSNILYVWGYDSSTGVFANGSISTQYVVPTKAGGAGTYAASGTYTSVVQDIGWKTNFTTLPYSVTTPANTAITVDMRAGNTATPDGTWTSWVTGIANGGSISALNGNRYFQYRLNLSSTNNTATPTFNYFQIGQQYYPGPRYYVATTSASNIPLSGIKSIDTIAVTSSTPTGTSITGLVTFDGGTTWKYWNGTAWTTSTLPNIISNGMTISALTTAIANYTVNSGTDTSLGFAFALSNTDPSVTPTITSVQVNMSVQLLTNLTCPSSLYVGQGGTCNATLSSQAGNYTLSYSWTMTNGNISNISGNNLSATATPSATGSSTVSLTVTAVGTNPLITNTLSATITGQGNVPVISNLTCPTSIHALTTGQCTATVTANYGPVTNAWSTSADGTITGTTSPVSIVYNATGSKTVTLTATGVGGTATQTANISVTNIAPIGSFNCPASLYVGQPGSCSATLDGTQPTLNLTYAWSMTGGAISNISGNYLSATATPSSTGSQTVTLTATVVGSPSLYQTVTATVSSLNNVPVISNLTCPTSIHALTTGQCTATVTSNYGSLAYTWNTSSDGTITGTTSPVSIVYNATGTKSVTLSVTSVGGTASQTANITVTNIAPMATFTCPSSLYNGQPGTCTATLDGTQPTLNLTYAWNFTGGTVSNISGNNLTATITPAYTGAKTVTLTATVVGNASLYQTMTANITDMDNTPVISNLTCPTSIHALTPGQCTATVTTPYGALTYAWSISTGGTLTGTTSPVSIVFNQTGNKNVTLNVTGVGGSATQTANITVTNIAPIASIACPSTLYVGQPGSCAVTLDGTQPTLNLTYAWSMSGGNISNISGNNLSATATPATSGNGTVTLTASVIGNSSLYQTVTANITDLDNTPVISNLTCPNIIHALTTGQCTATATVPYGTLTYNWSIGTGGTVTGSTSPVSIIFTQTGNKYVTLNVTGVGGSASQTANITVTNIAPIASVTCPSSLYVGQPGSCTAVLDTTQPNLTLQYAWSMTSGSMSNVSTDNLSATATPSASGQSTVSLTATVTGYPNLYQTVAATITDLDNTPIVASVTCPATILISMQDNCTVQATAPYGNLQYSWHATSGTATGTGTTATVSFTALGNQTVSVQVTGAGGNVTKTANINVLNINVISSVSCPLSLYVGQPGTCTATLDPSASNFTLQFSWSATYGTAVSNVSTDNLTATITPANTGSSTVKLTATVVGHSALTQTVSTPVTDMDNTPVISSVVCPASLFRLKTGQCTVTAAAPYGGLTYKWNAAGGTATPDDQTTTTVAFTVKGNENVSVTATGVGGSSYKSATVLVQGVNPPTLTATGPMSGVVRQNLTYTAKATSSFGDVAITWAINGQTYQTATETLSFDTAGNYPAVVTATIAGYEYDDQATATQTINTNVIEMPQVGVHISPPWYLEVQMPATFTGSVSTPYSPVVSFWTLPDGSKVQGNTLVYTPKKSEVGSQTITFTAYVDGYPESTATATKTVVVKDYNFPNWTLRTHGSANGYAPYSIYFTADASSSGGIHTFTYAWNFGDGSPTQTVKRNTPMFYTYTENGTYTVTCKITDDLGHTGTYSSQKITVTGAPPFVISSIYETKLSKYAKPPMGMLFKPIFSGGNPGYDRVSTYQWTLDGQPLDCTSSTLRYEFDTPGTFTIGLTATTNTGKVASQTATVEVLGNQPPTCSDIQVTDYPKYKYTKLYAVCHDVDGYIWGYNWDLDDGQPAPRSSPAAYAFYYKTSGSYSVTLTVTDNDGATYTIKKTISITR